MSGVNMTHGHLYYCRVRPEASRTGVVSTALATVAPARGPQLQEATTSWSCLFSRWLREATQAERVLLGALPTVALARRPDRSTPPVERYRECAGERVHRDLHAGPSACHPRHGHSDKAQVGRLRRNWPRRASLSLVPNLGVLGPHLALCPRWFDSRSSGLEPQQQRSLEPGPSVRAMQFDPTPRRR